MFNNKVIIISGSKGEGKTSKIISLIKLLKINNIQILGFYATAIFSEGERNSYHLVDINSNKEHLLCTSIKTDNFIQIGNFYFNKLAILHGKEILEIPSKKKSVAIIDEVGPFELRELVWHDSLTYQLENTNNILVITVRDTLVDEVIKKYRLRNISIFMVDDKDEAVLSEINQNS